MGEIVKYVLVFIVTLFAVIGVLGVTMNLAFPSAQLLQVDKPPATMNVVILDDEIWLRLIGDDGKTTKFPGNLQVEIAHVSNLEKNGYSLAPEICQGIRVTEFPLVYYSNEGYASNIYASPTGIMLPEETGLYRISAEYWPKGQGYSIKFETFRVV